MDEIILLSNAVIDRTARLIIERDEKDPNKVWVDNGGTSKWYFEGDDARTIWDFYFPTKDWKES